MCLKTFQPLLKLLVRIYTENINKILISHKKEISFCKKFLKSLEEEKNLKESPCGILPGSMRL
jgi:hypothetical protein